MKRATGGSHFISRDDFHVPAVVLDRTSDVPLHRQIYREIAQAIRGGAIRNGVRLPSTRVLASLLRVSRNTVLAAYDDLAADNLLRGKRGAGMRVCHGATPELNLYGLRQIIRKAGYPGRVVAFEDSDGNPLYLCI